MTSPLPSRLARPRLQAHDVALLELELGRVFDGDDSFRVGNEGGEGVEQGRLAGAGAAGDDDVQLHLDAGAQELSKLSGEGAGGDEVLHRHLVLAELSDGDRRALRGDGRDDDVDTRAVGEARVNHGRGLVDAAAERRDDSLRDPLNVVRVAEADGAQVQPPFLLIEDGVGRVDHDFGYRLVSHHRLDWPQAQDLVRDGGDELVARDADDARHLLSDEGPGGRLDGLARLRGIEPVEFAGVQFLDETLVQLVLELGERFAGLKQAGRAGGASEAAFAAFGACLSRLPLKLSHRAFNPSR